MSERISDILVSINTGTVEWIFLLLIPAALIAAVVYFDAFNLIRLSRDLKRVSESVHDIPQKDAPERMRAAEEVFAGPMHEAIRNAWSISLVRPPENVPPVAVKELRTSFGVSSVINLPMRRRLAELVPAGLFVIGLLGAGLDLLLTSARMNAGLQYCGLLNRIFQSVLPTLTTMILTAAF